MVLIGGATAVYKLSKRDAQRIEEHTGVPPEELEDEDLQAAMTDLDIQNQPTTEAEKAQLMADEGPQDATSQSSAAPAGTGEPDYIAELERLADLRDKGIVTDEEFEAKKRQLLGL
jgi:predicted PhzF superfamily epimerase YddE/YHI9